MLIRRVTPRIDNVRGDGARVAPRVASIRQRQQFPRTQAEALAWSGVTFTAAWRELTATAGAGLGGTDIIGTKHLTLSGKTTTDFSVVPTPFAGKTAGRILGLESAPASFWNSAGSYALGADKSIMEVSIIFATPGYVGGSIEASGQGSQAGPQYAFALRVANERRPVVRVYDSGGIGALHTAEIAIPHEGFWYPCVRGVDRTVQKAYVRTPLGYAEVDITAVGSLSTATPYRIGTVGSSQTDQACAWHGVVFEGDADGGADRSADIIDRIWRGV